MIKEDVVSKISRETGCNKSVVSLVVDSLIDVITLSLSRGEKVKFSGFGTFEAKERAARTGRNPHTNEAVPIPARIMPVFVPGSYLKQMVSKSK